MTDLDELTHRLDALASSLRLTDEIADKARRAVAWRVERDLLTRAEARTVLEALGLA